MAASAHHGVLLNSWEMEKAQQLSGSEEIRPKSLQEQQQLRYQTEKAMHRQRLKRVTNDDGAALLLTSY